MSATDKVVRPIIIKKKIIIAAGHHGGAWKVAYADFVTAMMAFFLLMWLLSAADQEQREGIAAYFSPGVPVFSESGGGSGMFGGETIFSEETRSDSNSGTVGELSEHKSGNAGATGVMEASGEEAGAGAGTGDAEFTEIENMFRGNSGESWAADPLLSHVATRVTDEGLTIDIFDLPDSPLFEHGTNQPTEKMLLLLEMISRVIGAVTNNIAISGHIDRIPEEGMVLDGFALTGGRALVANAIMIEEGVDPARFTRLTGGADRTPVGDGAPEYRNRRLEIVLLRRDR